MADLSSLQVSFRLRLTLFFVLIVVLPMVALAVLVSQVASDSRAARRTLALSAELGTATTVFEHVQADSRRAAGEIANEIAADPAAVSVMRAATDAAARLARGQASGHGLAAAHQRGRRRGDRGESTRGCATASVDLTADGADDRRGHRGDHDLGAVARTDRARRPGGRGARRPGRADHGRRSRSRSAPCRRAASRRRWRPARATFAWRRPSRSATEQVRIALFAPRRRRGLPLLAAEGRDRRCSSSSSSPWRRDRLLAARAPGPDQGRCSAAAQRIGGGDFSGRGAGRGQRRDGRPGERVQQDERPAL